MQRRSGGGCGVLLRWRRRPYDPKKERHGVREPNATATSMTARASHSPPSFDDGRLAAPAAAMTLDLRPQRRQRPGRCRPQLTLAALGVLHRLAFPSVSGGQTPLLSLRPSYGRLG
ncbi:hypothetical protein VPH35_128174 [Triticum aestivum]